MRKTLSALSFCLLLSCSRDYVVNAVHSPQFEGKGEVQVGASLKTVEFSTIPSIEPEVAWAVTNHFGIMANGSFGFATEAKSDTRTRRNFFEGGIGYFGKLSPDFYVEAFAGYGRGNISEDNDLVPADSSRATYGRYFLQPSVSYRSVNAAFVLAPRLTYAGFDTSSAGNAHVATLDPTFIFQIGHRLIFVTEAGYSIRLSKGFNGDYDPLIFTVGLKYRFSR